MENYPGPTVLIKRYGRKVSKKIFEKAKELIKKYANKAKGKKDIKFLIY
jgi:hypothetical protein